ncbi:Na+/H+ antiporter NhaC family protein [Aquibacillus koreensis]|uniref:Na+/H+ antiporter NhaC family protein n=1 Tax=Aquibacillus koreensis TaxID=279446 RepID=A0A9X4AJG2_9BACI|nr:Na+/H+ antiporter NhaC family protein [Aquibacillus koreensis]MCT2535914.1 Na+/H+ antiporter NhaC family protein [Aquibacillus koreensis]MDC3420370.1 Na+/H+ antiporter NhaC family protein [Aquibacillus koreensis]
MEGTVYSLIPALLMLVLVLVTRRVLLSLGVGVLVGAFVLHEFNIVSSFNEIVQVFLGIFFEDGALNTGSIYLLGFLLLLGVTTAFMTASGGSKAFGDWAIRKIKTRKGAQLLPAILGIIIFIDDYFNSLAVGQVARPVTDRQKVSRVKLAYFIDSTSAPITVISPISSWGAYIIGTIGGILTANEIIGYQPLEAFVKMIPFNMYAITAIVLVFIVILLDLNVGPMKKHEDKAKLTGELFDMEKGNIPGDLKDALESHKGGKIYHLLVPIGLLIIGTVVTMVITGILNTDGKASILSIFENTDVNFSLFIGGLSAVLVALVLYMEQSIPKSSTFKIFKEGFKAMLPAIYILLLAWMIGSIINSLGTGQYLAELVQEASIDANYIPLLLFVVASFMAFATGTSWGTFGIMLPIAGEIAAVTDVDLVLPAMAAVLAGAVFGDHCSPISDTSILSSTGAGSNHIDHVITQLPYAFICAIASAIGYLILGLTGQLILSLLAALVATIVIALALKAIVKR